MAPSADAKSTTNPLRIGVLLLAPVQLLDVAAVDLFGMLAPEYLSACNLPAPVVALGVPVYIQYISVSEAPPGPGAAPVPKVAQLTAAASLLVTCTLSSPSVQPGQLDIILVPGPDPKLTPPQEMGAFLRAHHAVGTVLMSVCTGIFPLAASGVLTGRTATGPRALIRDLSLKYPDVKWTDKRWVRDEEGVIWCSGGITNGLDMVSAYLRLRYPGPLSDVILAMADTGDRGQEYGVGKSKDSLWWLGLIIRSWWVGSSLNVVKS